MTREFVNCGACPSQFVFDKAAANELDGPARKVFENHLRGCRTCEDRHRSAATFRSDFLNKAPTLDAHTQLLTEHRRHGTSTLIAATPFSRTGLLSAVEARKVGIVATMVGMAAAVVLAAGNFAASNAEFAEGSSVESKSLIEEGPVRQKGSGRLLVYIKHGDEVLRGRDGSVVRPGDAVRFAYGADERAYLSIIGWDGRRATVHFPSGGEFPAPILAAAEMPLNFAIELDAVGDQETFYGLFCPQAVELNDLALEPVLAALRQARPLPLPPPCHVDVVHLRKELLP